MKGYFLKMLQDALFTWIALEVGIITTSFLYAFLIVFGVSENNSLLVAFTTLIVLILLGLLLPSNAFPKLKKAKEALASELTLQRPKLRRHIEQLTLTPIESTVSPIEIGQEEAALADIAHTLAHDNTGQWFHTGNLLVALNQNEDALTAYEQAIRLDPNYALAYQNKGAVLFDLKRYEDALNAFDQAIRLDPNYALAYYNKGAVLSNFKRYEDALNAFDQAIRLDPNYVPAYQNKGAALIYLKRYEEALSALDLAIRLDPNLTVAYYYKGAAFERLGKKQEAQEAYDRAR